MFHVDTPRENIKQSSIDFVIREVFRFIECGGTRDVPLQANVAEFHFYETVNRSFEAHLWRNVAKCQRSLLDDGNVH